jgi:hypothetical protein
MYVYPSLGRHHILLLHLIHCDVWTSPVLSISGSRYYLVLIDDFSHYCWLFPLKCKSDVRDHIVSFLAYTKSQFQLSVKAFFL